MTFDEAGRCTNAFEILSDPVTLLLAYNSIKSKPGNMTEGIDDSSLDEIGSN